jgi:phage recombination protein Bet
MAQAQKKAPQQATGVAGTELVAIMAKEQHLDPQAYASTVMKSCFDPKNDTTPEQFMAFLMIAKEHKLNPITREIYAFAKGGKVTPIVSIDGWLKIINDHPEFMGMEFRDELDDDGDLVAITCKMHRVRQGQPTATEVTEYLDECRMPTEPWKKWPARMLRHKATIQCARYTFGFSGIMDADEAQRMEATDLTGTATVVEDVPDTAAKRIVHKIKAKAEKKDLAPETDAQEVSGGNAEVIVEDADPETGEIAIDDIPGLQKGSEIGQPVDEHGYTDKENAKYGHGETMPDGEELTKEQKEWVEDMGKGDD